MNIGSPSEDMKIEIKEEESCYSDKTVTVDLIDDLQPAIKTDEEEIAGPSEPTESSECDTVKTEEISIISVLPAEKDSYATKRLYRCYICAAATFLENKLALYRHLWAAHPHRSRYSCSECSEHRATIVSFNQHLQHHDASICPFKCDICPLRYLSLNEKKQHEADVHQRSNDVKRVFLKKTVCPVCNKTIPYDEFEQHFDSEHPESKHVCSVCGEEFYSKDQLMQHSVVHRKKIIVTGYKCNICKSDKTFESNERLKQHLEDDHPKQVRYRCEECDYWTRIKSRFNSHLSRHDASKKPFKCNICSVGFTMQRYLQYHELMKHNLGSSQPHYECTICKKQLASLRELTVHMRAHTIKRRDPDTEETKNAEALPNHKCYLCNAIFGYDRELTRHVKTQHVAEAYLCGDCEYSTRGPIAFNRHLKVHDTSIILSKCNFCARKFSTEKYKQLHEVTIHGQSSKPPPADTKVNKLWKCYSCDDHTLLQSKQALVKHLRTKHTERHVYECDKCSFSTRSKLNYNYHRAKHDESANPWKAFLAGQYSATEEASKPKETNFSCSACMKVFPTQYRLKLHEYRMEHGARVTDPVNSNIDAGSNDQPIVEVLNNRKSHPKELKTMPKKGVKCYLCRGHAVMPSKSALEQHLQDVHAAQSMFQCRKCNFCTNNWTIYNNHRSKHDPTTRKFKCRFCQQRFLTARYRRYHEAFIHRDKIVKIKTECPDEETSAQSQDVLELLENATVMDINYETLLNDAIKTEEVEIFSELPAEETTTPCTADQRKYKCYICDPSAYLDNENSLSKHLLISHPYQGKYDCSECHQTIANITSYNKHLQLHDATILPFKCAVCSHRFFSARSLSMHQTRKHPCIKQLTVEKSHHQHIGLKCETRLVPETSLERLSESKHKDSIEPSILKAKAIRERRFICYLCSIHKVLVGRKSLLKHLQAIHPKQSLYQCKKCNYCTKKLVNFNNHHARHDRRKRKYKCSYCQLRFFTVSSRKYHEIVKHKKKCSKSKSLRKTKNQYRCYLCNVATQLSSKASLLHHHAVAHPQQESYQCKECSARFKSNTAFNEHISRHDANERPHKCSKCSMRFCSRAFKNRHEMFSHGVRNACSSCEMKFPSVRKLMLHEYSVHGVQHKKYDCSMCDAIFFLQNERKQHEISVHYPSDEDEDDFEDQIDSLSPSITAAANNIVKCYVCPSFAKLKDENALKLHFLSVHPHLTAFHCSECNMDVNRISAFNQHLRQHDASLYPHKCAFCPRRFDKIDSKSQHEADVHQQNKVKTSRILSENRHQIAIPQKPPPITTVQTNREKPSFSGNFASYVEATSQQHFQSQSAYVRERTILTCYLCSTPTKFPTKTAMQAHLKADHKAQPLYKCTECDYLTIVQVHFNNHHQKHDAKRAPHKCSLCSLRFYQPRSLMFHEATDHGLQAKITIYTCSTCEKSFMSPSMLRRHQQTTTSNCARKIAAADGQIS